MPPPSPWRIPSPETREHPGAAEAPASSPTTYPDTVGFAARSRLIQEGLAQNDLAQWRRGYFTGGDPGKYLPGPAMAKLMLNPDDAMARQYMNDDRSPKEHYHFAAVNWARFYPLFGEGALTPETRQRVAAEAAMYSAYLTGKGTENHRTMWWTSANVLPHFLENGGRLANRDKETALTEAKRQLKEYVRGLYAAGQGEWDSSTYLMFDVNGMLNIYDFSPDPEARLLAKAALDWLVAGYALKYRDGVYTSPNQRGFASGPVETIADKTGWLWWGSHAPVTVADTQKFNYAMHPLTSSYRPSRVLTNIATKNLPTMPYFEQRNSKPNYWHGQEKTPTPNQYRETVYNTKHYTLGSLWNGFGGQMTRMQLVADSATGGIVFTGGHPRHSDHEGKRADGITYKDGGGRYDQSAQAGGAYILLSKIPDDEALDYVFFSRNPEATRPEQRGKWWVMRAGNTFIGLYGLGEETIAGETDLTEKQRAEYGKARAVGNPYRDAPRPIFRFTGRRTGFILQTSDRSSFPSLEEFAAALEQRAIVDTSRWAERMEVRYVTLARKVMRVRYQEDAGQAEAFIDSRRVDYADWPVYDGPYIRQKDSVLTITDGRDGYIIEFTGDLPVYRALPAPEPEGPEPAKAGTIPPPAP